MLKVNEYFDGRVKSISFHNQSGKFTCGVMMQGEYEFHTQSKEDMTVISGEMKVQVEGQTDWITYRPFETFTVPAHSRFRVIITVDACAYLCKYD